MDSVSSWWVAALSAQAEAPAKPKLARARAAVRAVKFNNMMSVSSGMCLDGYAGRKHAHGQRCVYRTS
ncbi:hypothetical protein GCM10007417_04870 [Glycocaulis alkaliphilus]|nr:hypothetical protein GCM10007417_04870 [Glycocaulis alkaliphilus]